MRIKTTFQPIGSEHVSQVDLVRRGDPPPYSRPARWMSWIQPGGMVWTFVWLRIVALLFVFGMIGGLSSSGPVPGVPYTLSSHRLRQVDLTRIVSGQPVLGRGGRVIDPVANSVSVFAIHPDEPARLRYRSREPGPNEHPVYVLVCHPDSTYQDLVSALDVLRRGRPGAKIIVAPAELAAHGD